MPIHVLLLDILILLLAFGGTFGPLLLAFLPFIGSSAFYQMPWKRTAAVFGALLVALGTFPLYPSACQLEVIFLTVILILLRFLLLPEKIFVAVNDPPHLPAGEAELKDTDLVLGAQVGEETRAYPLSIAIPHHIIHDVVNGEPILVGW